MSDETIKSELEALRGELDTVDEKLLELYKKRLDIAKRIGAYKRGQGLPVTDAEREKSMMAKRLSFAGEELAPAAERLMELMIEESKRVQRAGLNIYLIGMPDCGKTRMGKKLKEALSMPLLDTDKFIMQRTGKSIDELFAVIGEEGFRRLEAMALAEVIRVGGHIVATGGGLPLWGDNAARMRFSGLTVFLDRALPNLLGQNLTNRPLLSAGGDPDANITRLYYERRPKYISAADIVLNPDKEGAAQELAEAIRQARDKK